MLNNLPLSRQREVIMIRKTMKIAGAGALSGILALTATAYAADPQSFSRFFDPREAFSGSAVLRSLLPGAETKAPAAAAAAHPGHGLYRSGTAPARPAPSESSLWDSELFSESRFMMGIRPSAAERKTARELARSFTRHMQKSELYMHYLLTQLKERGLPLELAAVPLVESGFNPRAVSHAGAHGVWQFTRQTGGSYGLQRGHGYDDFYDFIKSTAASLSYLEHLHRQFGDWDLALVAYNQGEFGIKRAIAAARARGVTDISVRTIALSSVARGYLRHVRAYAELLRNPGAYGASRPEIKNRPAFKRIDIGGKLHSMKEVATLSGADIRDLKHLNAGFLTDNISTTRQRELLVPVEHATALERAMARMD